MGRFIGKLAITSRHQTTVVTGESVGSQRNQNAIRGFGRMVKGKTKRKLMLLRVAFHHRYSLKP